MTKEEFIQKWILIKTKSGLSLWTRGTDGKWTRDDQALLAHIRDAVHVYNIIEDKVFWPDGKPDLSKVTTK